MPGRLILPLNLNQKLPKGYFAEPNVQFGIEIDVATCEEVQPVTLREGDVLTFWEPLPPDQSIPFVPATEMVEINRKVCMELLTEWWNGRDNPVWISGNIRLQ